MRGWMLRMVILETPESGDCGYLVHDGRVGFVVDPQRDIDRVPPRPGAARVTITHVGETDLQEDDISGGIELTRLLGIPQLVAAGEEVGFRHQGVADGDEVWAGAVRIRVVATPGHTRHRVSYMVDEPGAVPAVFMGGSRRYSTVGRTDLIGSAAADAQTRARRRSVRRLADAKPDHTAAWPTRGFARLCPPAETSGAPASSLGEERRSNPALALDELPRMSELPPGALWCIAPAAFGPASPRASLTGQAGRSFPSTTRGRGRPPGAQML